jgi:hypothetical protein
VFGAFSFKRQVPAGGVCVGEHVVELGIGVMATGAESGDTELRFLSCCGREDTSIKSSLIRD